MSKNNVWIASVAAPVMIMVLLLFAGSRNVEAADQAAAANAEVKIDNFVFWASDYYRTRWNNRYLD